MSAQRGYIWTIFVNAYAKDFPHAHVGNVLDDDATARMAGAIACYEAGKEDAAKICDTKATQSSVEMFGVAMRLAATAIRAKQ